MTAGCAYLAPAALPPGSSIAQARSAFGGPTGEYPLPGGGTRLEFAKGAFGRQTFMLDFDAGGQLLRTDQVLDPAHFAAIVPGMSMADVRMRLGRPAGTFYIGWQKLVVWNYRYFEGDCVLFQVSIDEAGLVKEAGSGYDSACDGPNGRD